MAVLVPVTPSEACHRVCQTAPSATAHLTHAGPRSRRQRPHVTFKFQAIGTHWEIESHEPVGSRLEQPILERIAVFDATYSRFRTDSLVSRIEEFSGCSPA